MRLIELFEDLPGLPGLMNIPKVAPINKSVSQPNNNSSQNNSNVAPQNTTTTISPQTQQQFSKGAMVSLNAGPSNIKTQLKISAVDSNNKTVTLNNPLRPNDPGITYKQADLSNIMNGQQNK